MAESDVEVADRPGLLITPWLPYYYPIIFPLWSHCFRSKFQKICRCCRGMAKLDLIQRRSGRNLGWKNLAWVHHGWPLPRWNLGTATAVEFHVRFNTSGKYHIWIYDIIFIDIHLYRPNLSYLFYSMLCVAARGPSCGAFAGSLGDTSTISWQRRWIWSNGWHPNGWFLWNHHGLYGILWICMEKTSWNITYLKQ